LTAVRAEPSDRAFIHAAHDRFAAAARAAGVEEARLAIAGRSIRLRFAGRALAPALLPALAHLGAAGEARDDLTISCFDSVSTGVAMVPPPFSPHDLPATGEVPGLSRPGRRAYFRVETGMLSLVDSDTGQALVWVRDAAQIDCYEAAGPLRHMLAAYFEETGLCIAHAGAVGRPGGGVLLGGRGGSGKSTTALLCLAAGMSYAGDDQVLIDPETGFANGLYATAKVLPATVARFTALAPLIAGVTRPLAGEKLVAFLSGRPGVGARFPLRAIVLPRVSGGPARLSPISAGEALLRLAPSTLLQSTGTASTMTALARVAARVPAYQLELGEDPDRVPAIVDQLLRGSA
jgi:hypothetical protein